jgi:hypothetical protein
VSVDIFLSYQRLIIHVGRYQLLVCIYITSQQRTSDSRMTEIDKRKRKKKKKDSSLPVGIVRPQK